MINILALYRGRNLADVETVAATADPELVCNFARQMLSKKDDISDKSLRAIRNGERKALNAIISEVTNG